MIETVLELRAAIVDFLRAELVGPKNGESDIVLEPPFKRYTMGIVFPQDNKYAELEKEDIQDEGPAVADHSADETGSDDTVYLANQNLPACVGMSFFVSRGDRFDLVVDGARYEKETSDVTDTEDGESTTVTGWRRIALHDMVAGIDPISSTAVPSRRSIFNGHADLHLVFRPSRNGYIVTVTIINNRKMEDRKIQAADCLHQVVVRANMLEGTTLAAYPRSHKSTRDIEDQILDLMYLDNATYGVGHGCSVMWETVEDSAPKWIATEYLPSHEIPAIKFELDSSSSRVLSFNRLAELGLGDQQAKETFILLREFVEEYRSWINSLRARQASIDGQLVGAFQEIIKRLDATVERMERGIKLLEHNENVLRSFCLANEAMLLQRTHSGPQFAGARHQITEVPTSDSSAKPTAQSWRPFQLAFFLLSLSPVAFEQDFDRDVVDLIWFPTGGGKTEAYLAVTAFLMFYRRLKYGIEGGGTSIIMRYTLRLLTTQQLQRAATLVCACEVIRRRDIEDLGEEPFTIGLWVGGSTTPNTYQQAYELTDKLLYEDAPKSPFQIDRCPWCGTEIVPETRDENRAAYGFAATNVSFQLNCPSPRCTFHPHIPVLIVDQQLYDQPPTILLATVDKFARLPWEERVSGFFGSAGKRAPDLIIQDELHLISGPLGTIVGLYETAIDGLIQMHGVRPKIIASTATIRRADDQIRSLYNRGVNLFPPSGISAADSYFARYDYSRPGRLYLGVLGFGHTPSTTSIRATAALLQTQVELEIPDSLKDSYWTLVGYHNSLRELGKTLTFASDDIPARITVIAAKQDVRRSLGSEAVVELTSNVGADDISEILNKLSLRHPDDEEAVSFLLCTNMLSVGVDVPRLGTMIVFGQPKSTSEYIQATSRVGRGNVPGLVVTAYSGTKPRDRSHYERFVTYHSAIYREVEPTSVTPFAAAARDRAISAVLVTFARHFAGMRANADAKKINQNLPRLNDCVDFILQRTKQIDPRELENTKADIKALIDEWTEEARRENLRYSETQNRAFRSLLTRMGDRAKNGVWRTLDSMRNVDASVQMKITNSPRKSQEKQSDG